MQGIDEPFKQIGKWPDSKQSCSSQCSIFAMLHFSSHYSSKTIQMNKYFLLASLLFCLSMAGFSQEESRLLRFPTLHGNHLVFSYAGDLYEVSASGGTARKLTNDPGYEMFSKYSPDGSQIALRLNMMVIPKYM